MGFRMGFQHVSVCLPQGMSWWLLSHCSTSIHQHVFPDRCDSTQGSLPGKSSCWVFPHGFSWKIRTGDFSVPPREVEQYLLAKDYGKAMETLETYRLGHGGHGRARHWDDHDDWSHSSTAIGVGEKCTKTRLMIEELCNIYIYLLYLTVFDEYSLSIRY